MATRREVLQRKDDLRQSLLQSFHDGSLLPGSMLPPLRTLALQYGVSAPTASQVIKELIEEGVLYTRSTAGTFVGRPQENECNVYLLVISTGNSRDVHIVSLRHGFEERISQFGGSSLTLEYATALRWKAEGRLPVHAGIFDMDTLRHECVSQLGVPKVRFGNTIPNEWGADMVYFDNEDGGRQATSHLARYGHQQIAFLGLHTPGVENDAFDWSEEREKGWLQTLEHKKKNAEGLSFHPEKPIFQVHTHDVQRFEAQQAARKLLRRSDISAVVAANTYATEGLIEALRESLVPEQEWPAIVSFDDSMYFDESAYIDGNLITSLRLPWEDIGREAANILCGRHRNEITGPVQLRRVPMRLVPRLSCRRMWASYPTTRTQKTLVSTATP